MQLDDTTISRAITETFMKEFLDYLEVDAAIVGAGPAGMTAGLYAARMGLKAVILESGICGGQMMNAWLIENSARAGTRCRGRPGRRAGA